MSAPQPKSALLELAGELRLLVGTRPYNDAAWKATDRLIDRAAAALERAERMEEALRGLLRGFDGNLMGSEFDRIVDQARKAIQ